jgi:hypothetical protein
MRRYLKKKKSKCSNFCVYSLTPKNEKIKTSKLKLDYLIIWIIYLIISYPIFAEKNICYIISLSIWIIVVAMGYTRSNTAQWLRMWTLKKNLNPWVQVSAPTLKGCVNLGRLFILISRISQFPHVWNSPYYIFPLGGRNDLLL